MVVKPLPLDVIYLIADQVDQVDHRLSPLHDVEEAGEQQISARQDVGRAMALVCRSWRAIGTELVWRSARVELPSETVIGRLLLYSKLAKLVKRLVAICPGTAAADVASGMDAEALITKCSNLRDLRVQAPSTVVHQLLWPAQLSSTLSRLSAISIHARTRIPAATANKLMRTICEVPALRRLALLLVPAPPGHLEALSPTSTPIRLDSLKLIVFGDSAEETAWLDILLHHLEPTSLSRLILIFGVDLPSQPTKFVERAVHLVAFSLLTFDSGLHHLLPRLRSLLASLRSLRYLSIDHYRDSTSALRLDCPAVFASLPPQLVALRVAVNFHSQDLGRDSFLAARLGSPLVHFTCMAVVQGAGGLKVGSVVWVKTVRDDGSQCWEEAFEDVPTWEDLLPEQCR